MKKKLLISDIAKQLDVSITTVSFILNGKAEEKRISKGVVEKVTKLVEELDFKPNQLAKSLRTGKTHIIGLFVEDIANPFFANVARLIEENAYKRGYKIFYCSTENKPAKTKELIAMFRERYVDGYIITPSEGIEEEVNALLKSNLPVVLFDRYLPDLDVDYVVVDNLNGTFQATNHLFEEGYKQVAFVTIESGQTQMQERLNGYEKAIADQQKVNQILEVKFQDSREEVVARIIDFIRGTQVDAIVFGTNYLGLYGLEAIRKLKISIPDQIGVVSFDDHDLFRLYTPAITAIAQPIEEISKQVMDILLAQLTSKNFYHAKELHSVKIPAKLIIRESSSRYHKSE